MERLWPAVFGLVLLGIFEARRRSWGAQKVGRSAHSMRAAVLVVGYAVALSLFDFLEPLWGAPVLFRENASATVPTAIVMASSFALGVVCVEPGKRSSLIRSGLGTLLAAASIFGFAVILMAGDGRLPSLLFRGLSMSHAWAFVDPSLRPAVVSVILGTIVSEEMAFRGALFSNVEALTSARVAIIVSALVFAAFHAHRGVAATVVNFALGVAAGVTRRRTGELIAPILVHVVWNTLVSTVAFVLSR